MANFIEMLGAAGWGKYRPTTTCLIMVKGKMDYFMNT